MAQNKTESKNFLDFGILTAGEKKNPRNSWTIFLANFPPCLFFRPLK
jgi:hypothetical protein